ncbi:unnamed protein product [Amoebophrya sp. A25]|nr:unnamed protein product [Amoebophrya sp. A25]CAD7962437.1 unnamed protein product [Amoebophrya sp. A25]|eukprot:GSA25T00019033001.1
MLGLGRTVTRLCHNPSTANEDVDDPKMNHQNDKVLRLLTASARAELDQAFEERKELNKMEPEEKRFWLKAHTRDHVVFFDGSKDPEGKSEPDEMVRDRKNEMESFAVALLVRELDFVIRAEREKMDDLHTKILRAQAQEEKEKMLLALLHEEKEKRALILLFQVPEVVEMCAKGLLPHLWEFVDPHDTNSNNVKSPKAKANARIAYFLAWGSLNENDPVLQRYAEDHVRPLVERFVNLVAEDEDLQNVVRDVRDKDKDDAISTEQREATENQLLLKPEKSDPCGAEEGVEEKEVSPLFTEKLKEALKPHMGKFFAFAGKFMELGS